MKQLYSLLIILAITANVNSQTLLFGGANGNGNFENGSTDWVIVNGSQTNKWVVSNNATTGFTGNCIYISSSAGAPYAHNYNTTAATYSYFYKDVAIPAGAKTGWLVFDYISNGHWVTDAFGTIVNDGLRIYGKSTTTTVTAGQELPGNFFLSGAYYNQPTWFSKQVRYLDVASFAGSTMRVIFQWNNDNSGGNQPPAGLDNIEMYTSCQEMLSPYQDMSSVGGNFSRIIWGTITGATGYDIRYRKIDDPLTVATYTTPVHVDGGTNYYYTLTNLSPGTKYLVEMRASGFACAEWTAHGIITTLNQAANDDCSNAVQLSVETNACSGTVGTFQGASPTASLTSICPNGANDDVWYKFVAVQTKQIIQTKPDDGVVVHAATNITLFTGSCGALVPVTQPCATQSFSPVQNTNVSRVIADGLTVGTTYYVRVNAIANNGSDKFRICVYNDPPLPQCPQLLTPADNSTLTGGVAQTFRWRQGVNAVGYRLRIIQQSGAYTEINTTDTVYTHTPIAGINYTWNVTPYNILDQSATCATQAFVSCTPPAQPVVTSVGNVLSAGSGYTSYQWYFNNALINGATSSQYTALQGGLYKVVVSNATGCTAVSADFNFVMTAINEIAWEGNSVQLYPNPVHDRLTINIAGVSSGNFTAQLVDINGRLLQTQKLKAGTNVLNLKNLPLGLYSVILRDAKSQKVMQVIKTVN